MISGFVKLVFFLAVFYLLIKLLTDGIFRYLMEKDRREHEKRMDNKGHEVEDADFKEL
ncbi:MAG: hypothetical protein ACLFQK_03365 [Fibrobacterota bacterium]